MRSLNNSEANRFDGKLNYGDHYFQLAQNFVDQLDLEQALVSCGLALQQDPQNTRYSELYNQICQSRTRLYRRPRNYKAANFSYCLWTEQNTPKFEELRRCSQKLVTIANKPIISVVLSEELPKPGHMNTLMCSLQEQVYPHWELLLPISSYQLSTQNELTNRVGRSQPENLEPNEQRLKTINNSPQDQQLSLLAKALATTTGAWIAIIKPEICLTPITLYEFIRELQQNPTLDIAYGDEDYLDDRGNLDEPWFKPDWSPELFLARNYFNSLVFIRRDLALEIITDIIKDLSVENKHDYVYDLLLRASEKTHKIAHISKILAHVQQTHHPQHLNNFNNCQLIHKTLQRRSEFAKVTPHSKFPNIQTIRYQLSQNPLISIIIPSKNLGKLLNECLLSIFTLSTYQNYEVILIDNGSEEFEALEVSKKWQADKSEQLRVFTLDQPFNYSKLNNFGASQARGDYLLFLNNDTQIITPDWLEAMIEQAHRKQIGAVGAMLLYSDNTIQHAGVILGVMGVAGHSHRYYPLEDEGYYQYLFTTNNVVAVTGACLMCRRDRFEQIGGFNERLAVAYNDVDFCLKLHQKGYQNLWLPHVKLYHHESQTRTLENTPAKQNRIQQEVAYMQNHWGKLIARDPFYNHNLSKDKEDYSLKVIYTWEVTSISLISINQNQLVGYFLDQPKASKKFNQHLEIVGWVIGKSSRAIAIKISCHDHLLNKISICQQRPDVAEAFPKISLAINSGFVANLDFSLIDLDLLITNSPILNSNAKLELLVTVVLANNTHIPIAKINLTC